MLRAVNPTRDTFVPLVLLAGDAVVTFSGLSLGYWLRYDSPVGRLGIDVPNASYGNYLPLLLVGLALLIGAFAQQGLYDARLLLRRYQSLNAILRGALYWLAIYLGVSLVLKFDPPISRLFVVLALGCVLILLFFWRAAAYSVLARAGWIERLRRRTVILGWNVDAQALAAETREDPAHPLILAGIVTLESDDPPDGGVRVLGRAGNLLEILRRESVDVVVLTRIDLPPAELKRIVETCERACVEWKMMPGALDLMLGGLRLQTLGRIPLVGVEELAIQRLFHRGLKRALDLGGAVIGLVLAAPLIGFLGLLIRRESPGGPIFFRQTRVGAGHREFILWKLRSMVPGAEAEDHTRQSTARGDNRLLRIGGFMRRWNLDELPQFWNVLRGDMSLVGPRPERPHHVERLAAEIPHYLPRHAVKPGMTGWAQVNGLRGDSDLAARIRHDIYYIQNWSWWLDVQIILLTFVRWKNAY